MYVVIAQRLFLGHLLKGLIEIKENLCSYVQLSHVCCMYLAINCLKSFFVFFIFLKKKGVKERIQCNTRQNDIRIQTLVKYSKIKTLFSGLIRTETKAVRLPEDKLKSQKQGVKIRTSCVSLKASKQESLHLCVSERTVFWVWFGCVFLSFV